MTSPEATAIGAMGARVDRVLRRLPFGIPTFIVETVSRLTCLVVESANDSASHGIENRVRGILSASAFHATGLRIGRGVALRGRSKITLGADVSLENNVFLSATDPRGFITIGSRTHIDVDSVLYGHGGLEIGSCCAIAAGVTFYSQTNRFHPRPLDNVIDQGTEFGPVTVGSDVWIGARAVILPGVCIGDHAVVGAGAVVTRSVEPWSVVGGVPARVLKDRRSL
jgi:acetyltransferase-like isoleucine patch superfamily enzyme